MTPDEAFGHLRVTLPDAIDRVVAEGVGRQETREQIAPYAGKLRGATNLEDAVALDERLNALASTDPPVKARLDELLKPVRDQAEAETIPGQVKQAAKDVKDAAKETVTLIEGLAIGYIVLKVLEHL